MPSAYLDSTEYATYGLPATTTAAQVQQASSQVDAFLKRKQGCVWTPDINGNPAYMAACQPTLTLTATGAIAPGASVVVPYSGPTLNSEQIGDTVVLDRASPTKIETCVITAVAPGTVTLDNVLVAHAASATMDLGMAIYEQRNLPHNRSIMRISQFPVMRLLSGYGRYGYGRRTEQIAGVYTEFNLLATISAFGGPPQWVPFDVSQASISSESSEIWVPAGVMLAYFSEVRLRYVAGWPAANLPYEIKQATANVVKAITDLPLSAAVKGLRDSASGISVDRFGATLLSDDTKSLLTPYQARVFG